MNNFMLVFLILWHKLTVFNWDISRENDLAKCFFFFYKVRGSKFVEFSSCLCRELHVIVSLLFVLSCCVL